MDRMDSSFIDENDFGGDWVRIGGAVGSIDVGAMVSRLANT